MEVIIVAAILGTFAIFTLIGYLLPNPEADDVDDLTSIVDRGDYINCDNPIRVLNPKDPK